MSNEKAYMIETVIVLDAKDRLIYERLQHFLVDNLTELKKQYKSIFLPEYKIHFSYKTLKL